MSGALMQLNNTGPELVDFTEPPEVNLLVQHFPRFANFAMQVEEDPAAAATDFGQTVAFTFNRAADFVGQTFVVADLPAVRVSASTAFSTVGWVDYPGAYLLERIAARVNTQTVSTCADHLLYLLTALTTPAAKRATVDWMLGQRPELQDGVVAGEDALTDVTLPPAQLVIPLPFWFSTGSFLPLACCNKAMPVDLLVTARTLGELVVATTTDGSVPTITANGPLQLRCFSNMAYLGTRVRDALVARPLEVCVEQLIPAGRLTAAGTRAQVPLAAAGICKEVIVVAQNTAYRAAGRLTNFGLAANRPDIPLIETLGLRLNGVQVSEFTDSVLTRCLEPVWYHTAAPPGVHVHAFCLNPESPAPTGGVDLNMMLNPVAEITLVRRALSRNSNGTTATWEEIDVADTTVEVGDDGKLTPGEPGTATYDYHAYCVNLNTLVFRNGFAGLKVA